jgi:tetratricopeptide (TPR) repeat protein
MPVTSERLEKLQQLLERDPNDPFLLYGIGLEHKKLGDADKAMEYLRRVIEVDPGYCYAYFQIGQVCESSGQIDTARATYQQGIEAARKKGDAHAESEIQGALEMLG